ncbi:Adhesion G protein-coupled receptor L4, partial [Biomphalaria glabrata]
FCHILNYTSSCKYDCRCKGSCDSDGNCIESSCSDGWFGSACQYSDVVINATILPQSLETVRSNSSRQDCGQRVGPQFVLLTWKVPLPITWLRIKLLNK